MKHKIDDKKFMKKYICYAHSTVRARRPLLANRTKPNPYFPAEQNPTLPYLLSLDKPG